MGHALLIGDPIWRISDSQTQVSFPQTLNEEISCFKLDTGGIGELNLKGWQFGSASSSKQDMTTTMHKVHKNFFPDPVQGWDDRSNKRDAGFPDLVHDAAKDALWIDDPVNLPWGQEHLAAVKEKEAQFGRILRSFYLVECDFNYFANGRSDRVREKDASVLSRVVKNLCEEGRLHSAVCAVDLMDQEGVYVSSNILLCLLQRCINTEDIVAGRKVHCLIVRFGYDSDAHLGSHLIRMFAVCGSLLEANQVFSKLPQPNVFTWSAIIFAHAKLGEDEQAIKLYLQMRRLGVKPDGHVLVAVLKACSNFVALDQGKFVHDYIIQRGLDFDVFIVSTLIDMYSKCGSIEDARKVFDIMQKWNVVTWNAMIGGYAHHGYGLEAARVFHQMQQQGIKPDRVTYVGILKACSIAGALDEGKLIHQQVVERGFDLDPFLVSRLIDIYGKCGNLKDARRVFDEGPKQNVATWNAVIAGYTEHGLTFEALYLLQQMAQEGVESNTSTFVNILKGISHVAALEQGKLIHCHIVKRGFDTDVLAMNSLINMYDKCGSLKDACRVFDDLLQRDLVTWNAMITAFAQHGHFQEALDIFYQLEFNGLKPNRATYISILKACSRTAALDQGKLAHNLIVQRGLELDVIVVNSLVDMYMKCGSLDDACRVFHDSPKRDVVTWTTIISGYANHGHGQEALRLFQQMQLEGIEANQVTFVTTLKACLFVAALDWGKLIHELIIKGGFDSDVLVINTLIDMYAKCGSLEDGHRVFQESFKQDVVTWTTMIAAYVQHECGQEALHLFHRMQQKGIEPDRITFLSLLKACSIVAAISQGKLIHNHSIDRGLGSDGPIVNTLIDMYVKCGSLEDASRVFEESSTRDVVTWSAMIAGCARCCNYHLALQYFHGMQQDGLEPNDVTFLSLLSSCGHLGLVDECFLHLNAMQDFGIAPTFEHFTCIAEVLGRAGHLSAAEDLFETIPLRSDMVGWKSLLIHCRRHADVDLGRRCFDRLITMDCGNGAAYVLMSNIYAVAGRQEDAVNIEKLRRCANAWKKPGRAFIEVDNKVHNFTGGDKSHPESEIIDATIKKLSVQMKEEGYKPHLDLVLQSTSEEEKEDMLCGHCEKQAIVFGLLNMPQGTTIRVSKNLRMCTDCHDVTQWISQIEKREIIVVDEQRIHLFKDGLCSCKDYY